MPKKILNYRKKEQKKTQIMFIQKHKLNLLGWLHDDFIHFVLYLPVQEIERMDMASHVLLSK